jgi:hypothetical protein
MGLMKVVHFTTRDVIGDKGMTVFTNKAFFWILPVLQ